MDCGTFQEKHLTLNYREDLTIKDLLDNIGAEIPQLKRIFSDQDLNDAKSNSLILINGKEISVLNGFETKLSYGDEIVLVPIIHGG